MPRTKSHVVKANPLALLAERRRCLPPDNTLLSQGDAANIYFEREDEWLREWETGGEGPKQAVYRQLMIRYFWDGLRLHREPEQMDRFWALLVENWGWKELTKDEWHSLTGKPRPGARPEDNAPSQETPATSPTPATPQPALTQPLSQLHLEYLRYWFQRPAWRFVRLADLLAEQDATPMPRSITLLDVYVPLKVDFGIKIITQDGIITDWWAEHEEADRPETEDAERRVLHTIPASDVPTDMKGLKLRSWPLLGVGEHGTGGEKGLQDIVAAYQRKYADRKEKDESGKPIPVYMEAQDAASVQKRFVLVGGPGSGKSSFLRHLALCHAGELRQRAGDLDPAHELWGKARLGTLQDWLLGAYTPLYIELRDLVSRGFPALPQDDDDAAPLDLPWAEIFWGYVRRHVLTDELTSFHGDLRGLFERGQALLLLDGLDEISERSRRRPQIQRLMGWLDEEYSNLRIIVTSRPSAYPRTHPAWELTGFGRAELRWLSRSRIEELAEALFAKAYSGDASQQAKDFIEAVYK